MLSCFLFFDVNCLHLFGTIDVVSETEYYLFVLLESQLVWVITWMLAGWVPVVIGEGTETLGLMVLSLEEDVRYSCMCTLYLLFAVLRARCRLVLRVGMQLRVISCQSSVDLGSDRNDELQGQVWRHWPAGSGAWSSLLACPCLASILC